MNTSHSTQTCTVQSSLIQEQHKYNKEQTNSHRIYPFKHSAYMIVTKLLVHTQTGYTKQSESVILFYSQTASIRRLVNVDSIKISMTQSTSWDVINSNSKMINEFSSIRHGKARLKTNTRFIIFPQRPLPTRSHSGKLPFIDPEHRNRSTKHST